MNEAYDMLRYVYVSARCPRRFRRLRRRLFHKAEIVGVEPRYPLPLPMVVPGGQSGWQQHQHVAHFDVRANPRQLHLPRPSPRRRPPHHCRSLAAAAAVVVGLLEHTIVVVHQQEDNNDDVAGAPLRLMASFSPLRRHHAVCCFALFLLLTRMTTTATSIVFFP